jgi:hypothetical protein
MIMKWLLNKKFLFKKLKASLGLFEKKKTPKNSTTASGLYMHIICASQTGQQPEKYHHSSVVEVDSKVDSIVLVDTPVYHYIGCFFEKGECFKTLLPLGGNH